MENAKKTIRQMAEDANKKSRACAKCTKMFMCNSIDMAICSDAFIEGYIKGYKQGRKG